MPLFEPPDVERLKAEGDVKGLIEALSYGEDLHVRWDAAEALGQIGDARALEPLVAALKDIRWAVASALKEIGEPAIVPLVAALEGADGDLRQVAAWTLGQMGDACAVKSLIVALKDKVGSVRRAAAGALGQIGDPRAVAPLIDTLRDADEGVRESAAVALGQIGDARDVHHLELALLFQCPLDVLDQLSSDLVLSWLDPLGGPFVDLLQPSQIIREEV